MDIGQDAARYITPHAARAIREAIAEVGRDGTSREVFLAGKLNAEGLVHEVRVCARGDISAVPAFLNALDSRDVVLHNHPSGDISPSEADVELGAAFGSNGHGVYIVNNDVSRVYVVVEPFLPKDQKRLDCEALLEALSPGSPLAKALPQFEIRPQQAEMMRHVAEAFNEDGIAVIEAPTGVGKTVAYLLPAVHWALDNRERIVVSTRTINLQEQIIHKDIPVLARCTDRKFSAVLVKGRGNYLCRRRLARVQSEMALLQDERDAEMLDAISEWAAKSADGTLSDLSFVPARDVWRRICSEAETCRGNACANAKDCFLMRARRDIARADILVVNHHMLFADLAIKKEIGSFTSLAVLPAFKRIIFDEAHNIEDSATEYFGTQVTRLGVLMLCGRLIRAERGRERGLLPFVKEKLIRDRIISGKDQETLLDLLDNQVLPALAGARDALCTAFDAFQHLAAERCQSIGRDIKWRLTEDVLNDPEFRELHRVYAVSAADEAGQCAQKLMSVVRRLKALDKAASGEDPPYADEVQELMSLSNRFARFGNDVLAITNNELEPNTVRWVEIDAKNDAIVRLIRCPLDVGEPLAEWVYANLESMVMTSATLSVRRRFDFLKSRIGLDRVEDRDVGTLILDSPFDFATQALLGIPTDIVAPDDRQFHEQSVEHIREALRITRGHAFILFTSFYALDFAFRRLEAQLGEAGITALKQGSAARTQLLDRFRGDPASVLFATDSFWEGVDVAGDALQCVILPKLPFRVPTEPILQARAEAIEAAGGNAFMHYTVPQAVIKFRQGFGRLIRRATDRGAVLVLDSRIVNRYYGRVFLESLPGVRVVKGPSRGVYGALRRFFAATGNNQSTQELQEQSP